MSDYFNGKDDILESIAKIQSDLGVLHYQIRNWKIDQGDLYLDSPTVENSEFLNMSMADSLKRKPDTE